MNTVRRVDNQISVVMRRNRELLGHAGPGRQSSGRFIRFNVQELFQDRHGGSNRELAPNGSCQQHR
jgi:hypothetical protein